MINYLQNQLMKEKNPELVNAVLRPALVYSGVFWWPAHMCSAPQKMADLCENKGLITYDILLILVSLGSDFSKEVLFSFYFWW